MSSDLPQDLIGASAGDLEQASSTSSMSPMRFVGATETGPHHSSLSPTASTVGRRTSVLSGRVQDGHWPQQTIGR